MHTMLAKLHIYHRRNLHTFNFNGKSWQLLVFWWRSSCASCFCRTQCKYVIASPSLIFFLWCCTHSFIQCPQLEQFLSTFHFDTDWSLQHLPLWPYNLSLIILSKICGPQNPPIRLLRRRAWVVSELRSYWVVISRHSSCASLCRPTSHSLCNSLNYTTLQQFALFRTLFDFLETLASVDLILKLQFYVAILLVTSVVRPCRNLSLCWFSFSSPHVVENVAILKNSCLAVCMFDNFHLTFNFKSKVSLDVFKNKNEC